MKIRRILETPPNQSNAGQRENTISGDLELALRCQELLMYEDLEVRNASANVVVSHLQGKDMVFDRGPNADQLMLFYFIH